MENQFVTYEIALKLKELGFNDECLASYHNTKIIGYEKESWLVLNEDSDQFLESTFICKAPLWQQIIDWFREKQNICTNIEPITFDDEPTYVFEIINLKNGMLLNDINSSFIDSSEALEQAILEALELIAQNRTK